MAINQLRVCVVTGLRPKAAIIEQITQNVRALVERQFTYETAVERYRNILGSLRPK